MANSTFRNNYKVIIASAAAVLIVAILFITGGDSRNGDNSGFDIKKEKLNSGEVRVEGVISCLPMKTGSTEDCIKALKGNDNKIYALDTAEGGGGITAYKEGTRVIVVGTYTPADISSEESNVFQYDGVLVVREFAQQ